ncbi:MAG: hypothetical protein IT272_08770 [Chitinophagales bacterium]|nr:hypothetical protein [Sphingobacteriales bacterium]MCC7057496.1 hypothetical protein [Chitinophagales bacterium]MDA0199994.1 hypothetical protein [Bacteroidota bacterium]
MQFPLLGGAGVGYLLGGAQGWVNLPDEGIRGKYKAVSYALSIYPCPCLKRGRCRCGAKC